MIYQLLVLICLFCGLIGFALGTIEGNAWWLLLYTGGAMFSLQTAYLATLVVRALAT